LMLVAGKAEKGNDNVERFTMVCRWLTVKVNFVDQYNFCLQLYIYYKLNMYDKYFMSLWS
jgi:hypothetical protein